MEGLISGILRHLPKHFTVHKYGAQIICLVRACVNMASVTHAGRSFLLRLHPEFLPRMKRVY